MKKNFRQYFERYSEPEGRALRSFLSSVPREPNEARAMAVIPLARESQQIEGCLAALREAATVHSALVICVVNQRANASQELHQDNLWTLEFLKAQLEASGGPPVCIEPHIVLGDLTPSLRLMVVDRASKGRELPNDQGVGLARKIGCDLAAALFEAGLSSDGFIRNTDGDARAALDFFAPITGGQKVSAAVYPFHHLTKDDGIFAARAYEAYLHYYVRGLTFAGSPYNFHTIGSTIACSAEAYVACRGFPRRDAGEDFYLLNKLAKVGTVVSLERSPVTLVARDSDRVPFGTGAACRRIEGLIKEGGSYRVYHPSCFKLLRLWLERAMGYLGHAAGEVMWAQFSDDCQNQFGILPDVLDHNLQLRSGYRLVLSKSADAAKRIQHFHIWFDGFRTMRFLNLARDHFFGDVEIAEAARSF